jgi:hypothetical protein
MKLPVLVPPALIRLHETIELRLEWYGFPRTR